MVLKADFHNHSCLSPCGSLELSPTVLVDRAVGRGIQALALSDHNSARNTPAFELLCRRAGVLPLCGIEVTTQEELHCLCLFPDAASAQAFGALVEEKTVKIQNRPEKWGDQVIVDSQENVMGEVEWWLGTATDLTLTALGDRCLEAGGLFIPAHIDRPSQSVLSQLGYLPDLPYSALEVRRDAGGLETRGHALVHGSDAHYPDDVGSRTCQIEVDEPSFSEVRRALARGAVLR
ncbi:MAG TPA: PHP domain-containing protein [Spirochaetia bacterium]|jgi:PHP family Zn ribbon phosphoesterase|nr:PHP domain-containing protein [Spirochaetia bacterium]